MNNTLNQAPPRCPRCGPDNLRLVARYSDPRNDRIVRLFKCACGDDVRDEQALT
jgi:hypothetical protein